MVVAVKPASEGTESRTQLAWMVVTLEELVTGTPFYANNAIVTGNKDP